MFLLEPHPQYVDIFQDQMKKVYLWDTVNCGPAWRLLAPGPVENPVGNPQTNAKGEQHEYVDSCFGY